MPKRYSLEEFDNLYNRQPSLYDFSAQPSNVSFQENTGIVEQPPVQPPKEETGGILGKVSRFTGVDALGRGLGKVLFKFTKEGKEVERLMQEGKISGEEYTDIFTGGLTNKEVLGSGLQTAATFVPGLGKGASLGAKVATGGGTGYAFDVAGNLQNNEDGKEIFKPGLGTVVGGGLPILAKITGLSNLGEKAKKLEEASLRMTPKTKENLAKKGQDVADYLAKKKVVGNPETRLRKVENLYENMERKVTRIVDGSGKNFKKKDLIDDLLRIPEKYVDDVAGYEGIKRQVNQVIKVLKANTGDEISASRLNNIKRKIMKRAYSKNNTDVVNDALHDVGDTLLDRLNSIPELKKLNKEYGLIIASRRILSAATGKAQSGLVGRALGATVGAGIGSTVGGGIGAGVGAYAGERVANKLATPIRSGLGAILQTIDDLPVDKMGNLQLTKKGLQDLIQQFRINQSPKEFEEAINGVSQGLSPAERELLFNLIEKGGSSSN